MPPKSDGGVYISIDRLYEQLEALNDNVIRLASAMEGVQKELSDKETRLRSVERWRYTIPVAYLGVLISFFTDFRSHKS